MKYRFSMVYKSLTGLICVCIMGCGGGGSGSTGQAQSTTVALQAGVTAGKATIVQTQFTSARMLLPSTFTPMMDFTLKSTINSNAGATASDVNITSEVITYEYIDSLPANLGNTLQIPPLVYYSNLIVPAGGTTDWQNVPVIMSTQRQYLKDNNPNATELRYKVKVTFNGYEVKNGNNVSVTTTGTLIINQ